MICRNCQAAVADDLIFCTNCGERLYDEPNEVQTVILDKPRVTEIENAMPSKSSSNLKWVALIVALIAIPASIFGVYLLTRNDNRQVSINAANTATPKPSPTRTKANTNQNANLSNANANANAANANANVEKPPDKNVIINERLEIAPASSYSVSFAVKRETAKIIGRVRVLQGEKVKGFVYTQQMYDENFPDEKYKVFDFDDDKIANVEQTLVKENYVLVLANETDKPLVVQSNFSLE